jgi:hypothetical protein
MLTIPPNDVVPEPSERRREVQGVLLHAAARRGHVVGHHHADAQSGIADGDQLRHGGIAESHGWVLHPIQTGHRVKLGGAAVSWTNRAELGMVRR